MKPPAHKADASAHTPTHLTISLGVSPAWRPSCTVNKTETESQSQTGQAAAAAVAHEHSQRDTTKPFGVPEQPELVKHNASMWHVSHGGCAKQEGPVKQANGSAAQ